MSAMSPEEQKELAIIASGMMEESLTHVSTDIGINYVMSIAHSKKIPKLCVVMYWTPGQIELSLRYQMEDWREPVHKFMDHELPPEVLAIRDNFPNMGGSVAYIETIDSPELKAILEI